MLGASRGQRPLPPLKDDVLIGTLALRSISWNHRQGDLEISFDPALQGRGLGSEAMGLILAFAFDEVNLHRVELGHPRVRTTRVHSRGA